MIKDTSQYKFLHDFWWPLQQYRASISATYQWGWWNETELCAEFMERDTYQGFSPVDYQDFAIALDVQAAFHWWSNYQYDWLTQGAIPEQPRAPQNAHVTSLSNYNTTQGNLNSCNAIRRGPSTGALAAQQYLMLTGGKGPIHGGTWNSGSSWQMTQGMTPFETYSEAVQNGHAYNNNDEINNLTVNIPNFRTVSSRGGWAPLVGEPNTRTLKNNLEARPYGYVFQRRARSWTFPNTSYVGFGAENDSPWWEQGNGPSYYSDNEKSFCGGFIANFGSYIYDDQYEFEALSSGAEYKKADHTFYVGQAMTEQVVIDWGYQLSGLYVRYAENTHGRGSWKLYCALPTICYYGNLTADVMLPAAVKYTNGSSESWYYFSRTKRVSLHKSDLVMQSKYMPKYHLLESDALTINDFLPFVNTATNEQSDQQSFVNNVLNACGVSPINWSTGREDSDLSKTLQIYYLDMYTSEKNIHGAGVEWSWRHPLVLGPNAHIGNQD